MHETQPEEEATLLKCAVALAFAAGIAVLLVGHVPGINGPDYWQWPWRRLPASRVWLPMTIA